MPVKREKGNSRGSNIHNMVIAEDLSYEYLIVVIFEWVMVPRQDSTIALLLCTYTARSVNVWIVYIAPDFLLLTLYHYQWVVPRNRFLL